MGEEYYNTVTNVIKQNRRNNRCGYAYSVANRKRSFSINTNRNYNEFILMKDFDVRNKLLNVKIKLDVLNLIIKFLLIVILKKHCQITKQNLKTNLS